MTETDTLRVLVVDDEPDVRVLLRVQLELEDGLVVSGEAEHGAAALEQVAHDPPDAVVMDLLMPVMNGFDAIAVLQRDHPHIGIVAYTAVAGDFVRQEMRRLGVELVLKTGAIEPLAEALRRSVATARG